MSKKPDGLAALNRDQIFALKYSLRTLKRGAGLTPERMNEYILASLQCFGVTTTRDAYEMLRTALDAMDSSQLYVRALLNAYGGEGLASDLKSRRRNFATIHGLTESRVFDLEDLALDEMLQHLEPPKPEAIESLNEDSGLKEALSSLTEAIREQTAALREIGHALEGRKSS